MGIFDSPTSIIQHLYFVDPEKGHGCWWNRWIKAALANIMGIHATLRGASPKHVFFPCAALSMILETAHSRGLLVEYRGLAGQSHRHFSVRRLGFTTWRSRSQDAPPALQSLCSGNQTTCWCYELTSWLVKIPNQPQQPPCSTNHCHKTTTGYHAVKLGNTHRVCSTVWLKECAYLLRRFNEKQNNRWWTNLVVSSERRFGIVSCEDYCFYCSHENLEYQSYL